MIRLLPVLVLAALTAAAAELPRTPAPEGARAYLLAPHAGERVRSPVRVVFGLQGMGVAPAGVEAPNTGHHHLLVDTVAPPSGMPIPNDAQHRHFGGATVSTSR